MRSVLESATGARFPRDVNFKAVRRGPQAAARSYLLIFLSYS
jgi:hypothetical protein